MWTPRSPILAALAKLTVILGDGLEKMAIEGDSGPSIKGRMGMSVKVVVDNTALGCISGDLQMPAPLGFVFDFVFEPGSPWLT